MIIERQIIIGMISNTEYLSQIHSELNIDLFESGVGRVLAGWCLKYYKESGKAPKHHIEILYHKNIKKGSIDKETAEELEEDILPQLSRQYVKEGIDVEELIKETKEWLQEQRLKLLHARIESHIEKGNYVEAYKEIHKFKDVSVDTEFLLDFSAKDIKSRIVKALTQVYTPVLCYGRALGDFFNEQLVRGGFVAFLAPEKRGKTQILIDMARRGVMEGRKVALFQAGDMTEGQGVARLCANTLGVTYKPEKQVPQQIPLKDCVRNQLNTCNKKIRECNFGIFEDKPWNEKNLMLKVTNADLREAWELEKDYKPCYNCSEYGEKSLGAVFMKEKTPRLVSPVNIAKLMEKKYSNKHLRISTHDNGSLSVRLIKEIINGWILNDEWCPDIVIIDYADLLVAEGREERHKQNQIWKDLRGLNQALNCLLVTATQADADSYGRDTLGLKNFNEDKRKYGHVTAMYGLNWDTKGREKALKIMRINELIVREEGMESRKTITVLQNLASARPVIDSMFCTLR